jgi:hypothetical protein
LGQKRGFTPLLVTSAGGMRKPPLEIFKILFFPNRPLNTPNVSRTFPNPSQQHNNPRNTISPNSRCFFPTAVFSSPPLAFLPHTAAFSQSTATFSPESSPKLQNPQSIGRSHQTLHNYNSNRNQTRPRKTKGRAPYNGYRRTKLNPNSAVDHGVENPFPLHWQSYLQEEEVPSELILINKHYKAFIKSSQA